LLKFVIWRVFSTMKYHFLIRKGVTVMNNSQSVTTSEYNGTTALITSVAAISALWIVVVTVQAFWGTFDVPPHKPAVPTLIAIAIPVIMFASSMIFSKRLRDIVLALDPVLLTEFQAWRILGGLFLAVYAFGHLPGFFAWPAGLGDVAVGIAAPFMAWQLRVNPEFLSTKRFLAFNYLGLADFVIAVMTGVAARNQITGFVDETTTEAMGQLPLVLIPTLIVPAFIILHLIVLMQAYERRRA